MTPYVGMNEKTRWRLHTMYYRSNADISPGDELYTSKDTYICSLALPHLTVARRLLEVVSKVTDLETVKIEFRHLLLSFFLQLA